MKLFLLALVSFIFINKAYSQNDLQIKFEIGRKRKITKVDVEGGPAGDTARRERIAKRLSSSKIVAKGAKRGTYTVRVRYIVDKEGNISNVECVNDPGYGLGAESVRAVKASSLWKPGPVRVRKY